LPDVGNRGSHVLGQVFDLDPGDVPPQRHHAVLGADMDGLWLEVAVELEGGLDGAGEGRILQLATDRPKAFRVRLGFRLPVVDSSQDEGDEDQRAKAVMFHSPDAAFYPGSRRLRRPPEPLRRRRSIGGSAFARPRLGQRPRTTLSVTPGARDTA
jgi:hypothetical protein